MALYPVMLELAGRLCVVVGAGSVGMRKTRGLLEAGARVRLVAPDRADAFAHPDLEWRSRNYDPGDLDGACLAFAATGDAEVDGRVAADARAAGIWVNLAADPERGDLVLPAVRRLGALTLAAGTGGASPALAALAADRAAAALGVGWQRLTALAAALRRASLTEKRRATYNRNVLHRLIEDGLVELLERGDRQAVDALLRRHCGLDGLTDLDLDRADLPL
ncbi:MAG: bifunctional precorrin-2 dehydrogenase/sirohydrochlorin ferrochelatase [Geothermobacteraceae bacterium]